MLGDEESGPGCFNCPAIPAGMDCCWRRPLISRGRRPRPVGPTGSGSDARERAGLVQWRIEIGRVGGLLVGPKSVDRGLIRVFSFSLFFLFSFPFSFLFIFEFLNLNPNSIVNFEFELDVLVQDVDMK
jgi:hypothetical protein